ncbi:MAG TPA: DUF4375 domain-containing protein [Candidatus Angelobacter sp.]|nr:DUF4375 domain-containing protein [Candidatus Angelobacter sp.]
MAEAKWLDGYSGQTVDDLIALEGEYRTDSLIVALEQALGQKAARHGDQRLSTEEHVVLAVEALEREVNNGGYGQFFANSSNEYAATIVDALARIGCPVTAEITGRAVSALSVTDLKAGTVTSAMESDNEERDEHLSQCDERYFNSGEDIAGRLYAYIKINKAAFKL